MLQPAHRHRRDDRSRAYAMGDIRGLQLHPRRDLGHLRVLRRGARRSAQLPVISATNILESGLQLRAATVEPWLTALISAARKRHLLESLEGKKGQPRFKPPFPASFGLYGKPTTINNTETFAAVPWIIMNGGEALSRDLGKPNNGGTKIFSDGRAMCRASRQLRDAGWARRSRSCSRWRAAFPWRQEAESGHSRAARRCRCCPPTIMMAT